MADRDNLITRYHELGLKYDDILTMLAQRHQIIISKRHLIRIVKRAGLSRRIYSNIDDIALFINAQLAGPGQSHGYRWMYYKCVDNGIRVRMEDVRLIIGLLDPDGRDMRKGRRLHRREYFSKGPNFIWHLDSYDKLKPFGICINGCIDGFSRKLIWLNAYCTSSDPKVIAAYYIEQVEKLEGCPLLLRGDPGTENSVVKRLHPFLRRRNLDNNPSSAKCYLEGCSTANQRIESFWRHLRNQCIDIWLRQLHKLKDDGFFTGTFMDKSILQYSLTALIQDELDSVAKIWNSHRIRPSRNTNVPNGAPTVMYTLPALYATRDYKQPVTPAQLEASKQECTRRDTRPCDKDMFELCSMIMHDDNLDIPSTPDAAIELYIRIREQIMSIMAQ